MPPPPAPETSTALVCRNGTRLGARRLGIGEQTQARGPRLRLRVQRVTADHWCVPDRVVWHIDQVKLVSQRDRFDIPNDVAYLNCAYMGPLSRDVVAAGHAGLERKMRPWTISAPDFFEPVEEIRGMFAQVIGADADGVAILPSVSYGVAVAATNLAVEAGTRIVLLAEQFPSNVYAWMDLAQRRGADVVTVARPPDGDWTKAVLDAIDERTSVATLPYCHWTDGSVVDLERVGARLRDVGAALVIDGTQSIGAVPFDVARLKPDFVLCAVYKWLLGPYGGAFLWCAPEHRGGAPIEHNWIARRGSGDFAHLVDYQREFRDGARRYDVGETSDFSKIPAIHAALAQTLEWGVDEIASYIAGLGEVVAARASDLGLGVAPAHLRAPHLVGVRLGDADAEIVAKSLEEARIHVSVRGDAMRVSPHVYNDEADVDRLFEVLSTGI